MICIISSDACSCNILQTLFSPFPFSFSLVVCVCVFACFPLGLSEKKTVFFYRPLEILSQMVVHDDASEKLKSSR